jgi:hypothetical protein
MIALEPERAAAFEQEIHRKFAAAHGAFAGLRNSRSPAPRAAPQSRPCIAGRLAL